MPNFAALYIGHEPHNNKHEKKGSYKYVSTLLKRSTKVKKAIDVIGKTTTFFEHLFDDLASSREDVNKAFLTSELGHGFYSNPREYTYNLHI